MKEIFVNNREGILAVASLVISLFQAFKIERLKAQLEIEKNKAILNDSKIREAYDGFVASFMNFDDDKNTGEINKGIKNFTKNMILFAGHNTIKAINQYKLNRDTDNNVRISLAENIFCAMRKDLGVDNDGIKHGDLIQFLISKDISNILNSKNK